jgi:hypothetical protein
MHPRISDCPRMSTFLVDCYRHYSYLGLLLGLHILVSSSQIAVTSFQSRSSNGAPRSSQLLVTGSSCAGLIRCQCSQQGFVLKVVCIQVEELSSSLQKQTACSIIETQQVFQPRPDPSASLCIIENGPACSRAPESPQHSMLSPER